MAKTVLSGFAKAEVNSEPFAHAVRDRPIDEGLYRRLSDSFPPLERFIEEGFEPRSNQAIRIPARLVIDNPEFSPEWREFFRHHTSQTFWCEIVAGMGDAIRAAHPGLEARAGRPLEEWTAKVRGTDGEADIALDTLFVINTPVTRESSVRPAHVDTFDKIWAGLFYMKSADDPTPGGDFSLYRFQNRHAPAFGGHYAPPDRLDAVRTVGYGENRFLAFVNSPDSIHGATPRPISSFVRRYINFVAVTPWQVFSLPALSPLAKGALWWQRRKTKAPGITLKS